VYLALAGCGTVVVESTEPAAPERGADPGRAGGAGAIAPARVPDAKPAPGAAMPRLLADFAALARDPAALRSDAFGAESHHPELVDPKAPSEPAKAEAEAALVSAGAPGMPPARRIAVDPAFGHGMTAVPDGKGGYAIRCASQDHQGLHEARVPSPILEVR